MSLLRPCTALLVPLFLAAPDRPADALSGAVADAAGRPVAGVQVLITTAGAAAPVTFAVATDAAGRFRLTTALPGPFRVAVRDDGTESAALEGIAAGRTDLRLVARPRAASPAASARWLARLAEGTEKRRFILDCTGCHQFNETRVFADGATRDAGRWAGDVARMLGFAGAASSFPVMRGDRDPEGTGAWLTRQLGATPTPAAAVPVERGDAQLTEYDLPVAADLPHDLAVDAAGSVVITGMQSHRMFTLDPANGAVREIALPDGARGPRAVELDAAGRWYVLFGSSRSVGRYDPRGARWEHWAIGMYPHSIGVTPDGAAAWFNDHFARGPVGIARLAPATGAIDRFEAPAHPDFPEGEGPVPYEARLAPDGALWVGELLGNRLHRLDPATGRVRTVTMPEPDMGPRRFDLAPDGTLWIPAYSANALVRLEPTSGRFTVHRLPLPDAVPYVARVHPRTGDVWLGTAAADMVFRFVPATARFTAYPVPTRGATMRHLTIDPRRGDVWVAYGASPAIHPSRILRLEPR